MTTKKRLELSVIFGLVFSVLLSFVGFEAGCNNVKNSVLRLHILANSNTEFDQNLKLLVRDEVLNYTEGLFLSATSRDEAKQIAQKNIKNIENMANLKLKKLGSTQKATAEVVNCYFNTRVYNDFTLPAGFYDAVRIKIGKAEGKNWWCVMFPKVCISASADIGDNLETGGENIVKNPDKYKVKFKTVEWYYALREKISSWF